MTRSQLGQLSDFDLSTLLPVVGNALTPFLSQTLINTYSTIEIRTAVSPPVVVNVADLLNTQGPPSAVSQFLKPTVILTERSGKQNVIAPYGVAENGSALPGVLLILGILGMGFVAGRLSKRGRATP